MCELKKITEIFPAVLFSVQKPPAFVEFHSKLAEDIILVSNKTETANHKHKPSPEITNNSIKERLDLTGSPLKIDLSLHLDDTFLANGPKYWNDDASSLQPIDINLARDIADMYPELIESSHNAAPMWLLTKNSENILLLMMQPAKEHFTRGLVTNDGFKVGDIDLKSICEEFCFISKINEDQMSISMDCEFQVNGFMQRNRSNHEDLIIGVNGGGTNVRCYWQQPQIEVPLRNAGFEIEQEVVVGHCASKCKSIWKSLTCMYSLNQILVDVAAAPRANYNIDERIIRQPTSVEIYSRDENTTRLNELLDSLEAKSYTLTTNHHVECVLITQILEELNTHSDMTYALWDILKESGTVEEIVQLLIVALNFVSARKFKPTINPQNKTYLSKLVLNLSRGHSQASKVIKFLKSNPTQALTLLAQVGNEKLCWEFNKIYTKFDYSFCSATLLDSLNVVPSQVEQMNQSMHDMTLCKDMNPFQNKSLNETSFRLNMDASIMDLTANPLNVSEFASLKKSGIDYDSCVMGEELDVGRWKLNLRTFAQLLLSLEHLIRAQNVFRLDFSSLGIIWASLKQELVCEKSSIISCGQLINDPLHTFKTSVRSNLVSDHVKNKVPFWIRIEMKRKDVTSDDFNAQQTYVYSQTPVFPPNILQSNQGGATNVEEDSCRMGYYCTKYLYLSNKVTL